MSEHDRHMVVIDADVSRFKRKMAEATDDATRRLRDTAREANAAFAPAGQMRSQEPLAVLLRFHWP